MTSLRRILMVEDDVNDVELTLTALAEYNLANEVVVVHDGEEAMDYLYRRGDYRMRLPGNPAVIMLDLKLPKVDGIEVLKQVKSDENLKETPVVILTSSKEDRDLEECYRLGANAYVVKPVNFQQFVEAVRQVGAFWALVNEPPPRSLKKIV